MSAIVDLETFKVSDDLVICAKGSVLFNGSEPVLSDDDNLSSAAKIVVSKKGTLDERFKFINSLNPAPIVINSLGDALHAFFSGSASYISWVDNELDDIDQKMISALSNSYTIKTRTHHLGSVSVLDNGNLEF